MLQTPDYLDVKFVIVSPLQTILWDHATQGLGSKTNVNGKNWDWANIITTIIDQCPYF